MHFTPFWLPLGFLTVMRYSAPRNLRLTVYSLAWSGKHGSMQIPPYLNNDDGYVVAFGDERASTVIGYSPQGHLEKAKVMRNISNNAESDYIVEFEDKKIKQICVDNWDISGDGEVSEYELSLVKDLNGVFTNFDHHDGHERYDNTFWELSYFTGLTSINDNEFGNSSIWAVSIPENVTRIGDNAFQRLYSVYIPSESTW